MITVRDIIVNACDEARLVNRNQPIPGNIFLSAFNLLQKRLNQYSNTNYLSFTRKELNFESDKNEIVLGPIVYADGITENDISVQNEYGDRKYSSTGKVYFKKEQKFYTCSGSAHGVIWSEQPTYQFEDYFKIVPDIEVDKLQEIVRVYTNSTSSSESKWYELNFVSYEDWYNFSSRADLYSVLPFDSNHVKLFLKTSSSKKNIKVIYNEFFEFNQDDELNIPKQYISLFTTGLVYDLSCQYPRLSDNTVSLLKSRLDELEENVRRSSSVNKFIGRTYNDNSMTYGDFINGTFFGL